MFDPHELEGTHLGPYAVQRLLGQGGFAWVFEARPVQGAEPVAIKVLKPRYSGDGQFEARFRHEARIASELHHPNIVRILQVGQADGYTYFVMPLYHDSLASLLERHGPLPEDQVVRIARDLVAGLSFAHEAGFVHRDIKPHNVLLEDNGTSVVADFGIARAVTGYVSATGVNMTIGTPQYISPEQAQGLPLDGRSDLYALGVALYKATTGDAPFRSTDWFELARMHVEDHPVAPSKKAPHISARFERVVMRCLAKHPDDRYPSAAALGEELADLQNANRATESFGIPPTRTSEFMARLAREAQRPRWLLTVAAVLVVAVVAVLVVLAGR
jgi:serine/threonine-protein kinase